MQDTTDMAWAAPAGRRARGALDIRRVLVPLDGTDRSAAVLADAAGLAGLFGGELVLATVLPAAPGGATGTSPDARTLTNSLQRSADGLRGQGASVSTVLLHGDPAEQLVGFAIGNAIDAIVMATRARWGQAERAAGSVTDAVVRASPVPVLLRRVPLAAGAPAFAGPQRLLVPLDGSRLAEVVLPTAVELAAATRGSLLLLQAIDDTLPAGPSGRDDRALVTQELRAAHAYLAAVATAQREHGVPIETTVRLGRPAELIGWAALDGGMDLIVMATHSRSGERRERLGSIALEVLSAHLVPLLLVSGAARPAGRLT